MKRRRLVLSTGAILLGAGCTTNQLQGSDGSPTSSPTATATATDASTAPPSESPQQTASSSPEQSTATPEDETPSPASETTPQSAGEGVSLQSALVYRTHPDAASVVGADNAQFLLVRVSLDAEGAPSEGAFSLDVGDRTFAPADVAGTRFVGTGDTRRRYEQDRGSGWLVFDLPRITTEDATIRLTANGQFVREDVPVDPSRLAEIPSFEVHEVGIQDGCLSFEVENTGERAGTFYGAFNGSGSAFYYYAVQVEVARSDTSTRRECYPEAQEYEFQWVGGSETGQTE